MDKHIHITIKKKGGIQMYEFTWKVFKKTGNIDIYLLLKELEKEEHMMNTLPIANKPDVINYPVS